RVAAEVGIDEGDDRDGDEAAAETEEHGRQPDEAADEHESEKFHSSIPAHRHQAGNRHSVAFFRDLATMIEACALQPSMTSTPTPGRSCRSGPGIRPIRCCPITATGERSCSTDRKSTRLNSS